MTKEFNFDKKMQELEQIISNIQTGELGIEESIKEYKKAKKILDDLSSYLDNAEAKVRIVNGESGN